MQRLLQLSQRHAQVRAYPLQWSHNEHDGVSKHQPHDCLLNRLFRRRSKKTSKLRVTGLCEGNSPVTGEFPAQRASNAENDSIWWRHHASKFLHYKPQQHGLVLDVNWQVINISVLGTVMVCLNWIMYFKGFWLKLIKFANWVKQSYVISIGYVSFKTMVHITSNMHNWIGLYCNQPK